MRTDAMLPLRGLQNLPTRAPARVDGTGAGNTVAAQEDGDFSRALRGAAGVGAVVASAPRSVGGGARLRRARQR